MERYKRLVFIVIIIVLLLSTSAFPRPALAWSAVVIDPTGPGINAGGNLVLRAWNSLMNALEPVLIKFEKVTPSTKLDLGSHQLMLGLARQRLEADPAFIDQKDLFPTRDGILGWEGVVVTNPVLAVVEGGSWADPDRGGPDANDSSDDSEHYYNPTPSVKKGRGPSSVEKHFGDLLTNMYNQGDFANRNKPDDKMDHSASWSAHYLADMYVPYHMLGIPAAEIKPKLSIDESGPDYLWAPGTAVIKDGKIVPGSYEKPPEWSGLNGDFSDIVSYFKSEYGGVNHKDWFDPWYYNGTKGAGPNLIIGKASHGSWESWAHKQVTGNKLFKVPSAYSKDWHNPVYTSFPTALTVIERQAAQGKAFAEAVAQESRAKIDIYTKSPEVGFNKASEGIATLWRASFTALRPSFKVTPDPGNLKLLKVTAAIASLEPNEPAVNVRARLTAEGGTVKGEPVRSTTAAVIAGKPWPVEWQVESANPAACKLKLEVTCEYKNLPDLQYAVASNSQAGAVTVEVTPAAVKPGETVTLTVRVSPEKATELTISDLGPLEPKGGLFAIFAPKTSLRTDDKGVYKGEYTVKKSAKNGSYSIKVKSEGLAEGTARLAVGISIKNAYAMYIRFANGVQPLFTYTDRKGLNAGYWQGDTPDIKVTGWDGEYTVKGEIIGFPGETGKLSVTLDKDYQKITAFTWEYSKVNNQAKYKDLQSVTMTMTGGGLTKGELTSPWGNYTPDFYYKLEGPAVCSMINVKINQTLADGTKGVCNNQVKCGPSPTCEFLFKITK